MATLDERALYIVPELNIVPELKLVPALYIVPELFIVPFRSNMIFLPFFQLFLHLFFVFAFLKRMRPPMRICLC